MFNLLNSSIVKKNCLIIEIGLLKIVRLYNNVFVKNRIGKIIIISKYFPIGIIS